METGNLFTLIFSIITLLNFLFACVVVLIERRDVGSTWAWLMILFFIPLLGFLFYIFFGRQLKKKKLNLVSSEEEMKVQSLSIGQLQKLEKWKGAPSKYKSLLEMNLKASDALITVNNKITIFQDGSEKFDALFKDILNATEEINVQYYIFQPDILGSALRDILTKKSKEGVKVRVLYDEVGSRRTTLSFFNKLIKSGGQVKVFFPSFFKLINLRINNRNHRKLCIIDGKIAYIGGFNVGDEYLGYDLKFGFWRDTHFRVTGEAVQQIQGRFFMDWSKEEYQKFIQRQQEYTIDDNPEDQSIVQIISSGPNSHTEHLKNMYLKMIASAQTSVFIQTPYFIPDSSFMDACKIALLSGVDVRIMIPSIADHPFVHSATLAHASELLPYGVKILQYEKGFLHAKTIVVDQEISSVGTTNIDNRSFRLNFEVNALVYDEAIACQLHEIFIEDSKYCSELTLEKYKSRNVVKKVKEAVARLLSPIL